MGDVPRKTIHMEHIIKIFSNISYADLASQIIASANSQEKAILIIKFNVQMSAKERKLFEEEIHNTLLQFKEPAIVNCIVFRWENDKLQIEFTGWNGRVILSTDGLMFIRPYCKISNLNQIENDNRCFTPIVIR